MRLLEILLRPISAPRQQTPVTNQEPLPQRRISAWGGLSAGALTLALFACTGGGSPTPVALVDPLAPAVPVDLVTAASTLGIESGGFGGDSNGDAGVAGAAGDGAPLKNTVVTAIDAKGNQFNGLTDSNGNYLIKFKAADVTAPLILRVVDAGGNVLTSVSGESALAGKVIRANINPLTDKITSDTLSATVIGTDKIFDGSKVDATKLAQATSNLVASVKAALATAGIADSSNFNPMKSVYKYDGTGVDAVIESISHSRDPATGATQLRAKLVAITNNAYGTATPTLISADTPLASSLVATPTSPALTFNKLNSWISAINRCLAMSNAAANADPICSNGSGIVSSAYLNSSKDLSEDLKTLFSTTDGGHVSGSALRNPVLLFTSKYPGSTASFDDMAVVEVTILQPSTGPLAGSLTDPIEYTKILTFKRDDSLVAAAASNWMLHGNQRNYAISVAARYKIEQQMNPARANNSSNGLPNNLQSRLHFNINKYRYDAGSRIWVDAGIRAVRVTGPGLPEAVTSGANPTPGGVVLLPTTALGQDSLGIFNVTGVLPASGVTTTSQANNSYGLAAIALDGSPLYNGYFAYSGLYNNAATMLTDFSGLQAYSLYKFEIFLNGNTSSTPDATEYARNPAPVFSPTAMLAMPRNDISPSAGLVQPPQLSSSSIAVSWANNVNAAPVSSTQVYTEERNPKGATSGYSKTIINENPSVAAAYSLNTRPVGNVVSAPVGTPFPSLTTDAGDYRHIAIWSSQGRANVQSLIRWDN